MITIKFENDRTIEIRKNTLSHSVLTGFDFHRAIFDNLDLEGADFRGSGLRSASLRNVHAVKANFSSVPLMTSDFSHANLQGAKFLSSKAMYSYFNQADLSDVDMTGANVAGADFTGSDLRGAVMLCDGVDNIKLDGARYDSATVWPDNFDPSVKNAVMVE